VVIDSHTIVMTQGEHVSGFHLKSGILDLGPHHLTTGRGGTWDRGMITGSGGFDNRGELTLDDTPTKTLQGILNNFSKVSHDLGNLNLAYASVLLNREESLYELTSDANITGLLRWDATPRFINEGTFRKAAGTATSRIEVVFNNVGGRIEIDSGTLSLVGTSGEASISSNGVFEVAKDAVLHLAGNNVNVFNGRYEGAGEGSVEMSLGTIKLGTDFHDVTFAFGGGGFVWKGGSIEPVLGALVNEGHFTVDGESMKNLGGQAFRNQGTVVHKGTGHLNLEYGSACHNEEGALYDLQDDVAVVVSGGEGPKPVFENAGRLQKSAGRGAASIRTPFENAGEVEVNSGMLNFLDAFVQEDGITRLRGGDLAASEALDIRGGTLAGAGRVFASVKSSGTLTPGNSAGLMVIHGDYNQGPRGRLEVEIGGSSPGNEYDQLQVLGQARMRGRLDVVLTDDFVPQVGDIFDIVQCRSCEPDFRSVNLPDLPGGLTWDVRYEHDSVRLFVVQNGSH
jgi:hypothetical protein